MPTGHLAWPVTACYVPLGGTQYLGHALFAQRCRDGSHETCSARLAYPSQRSLEVRKGGGSPVVTEQPLNWPSS
jgi:hypothetical protein